MLESFKSGLKPDKYGKKFLEIRCSKIVENVERKNTSTFVWITLCELLKNCLEIRGKPKPPFILFTGVYRSRMFLMMSLTVAFVTESLRNFSSICWMA